MNDLEIVAEANRIWNENHAEKSESDLTEVFGVDDEVFIHLANANGPLGTYRAASLDGQTMILQELSDWELTMVEAARLGASRDRATFSPMENLHR